jgi:hypothetical protein
MLAPGILFPWSLLLAPAGWSAWKAWRRAREADAVLGLTWFLGLFLFFSAVSGKRIGYILPIAPAVGLLLARYLVSAEQAGQLSWPRLYRVLARITLAIIGVAAVLAIIATLAAAPMTGLLYPGQSDLQAEVAGMAGGAPLALALPALMILGMVIYGWRRSLERPAALVTALIVLVVVASVSVDLVLFPRINHLKSGRNFSEAAGPYLRQADQVYLFRADFSGVYNIYTDRVSIPVILAETGALEQALGSSKHVAVIGSDSGIHEELGKPPSVGREAVRVRVGHRDMVLIVNWPETEKR